MSNKKKIKFGVMLNGAGGHMNAWKDPSVPTDASVNLQHYQSSTRQAEEAGFSFVFVADGCSLMKNQSPTF